MSLFGKLTKEELERYIQDYLNENGYENKKDEGRIMFTLKRLHCYIDITQGVQDSLILNFIFDLQSAAYSSLNKLSKLVLDHAMNEPLRRLKFRASDDGFLICVSYDLVKKKMFDSIFVDMKIVVNDFLGQLIELIDRYKEQQEQFESEQQNKEEETTVQYPKTTYYA